MVIIYTIPGHLTENTIVMQLLHKVVGVNSRIPRVHAVAGGSLLLLCQIKNPPMVKSARNMPAALSVKLKSAKLYVNVNAC